jgi:hypothetical protein
LVSLFFCVYLYLNNIFNIINTMNNNSKKSNREGTGKTHPCIQCDSLIPLHKKYCSRDCYNKASRIEIKCEGCGINKILPKNKIGAKFCSIQCSNKHIDRKLSYEKAKHTLIKKYNVENPFELKGYENMHHSRNGNKISQTHQNKSFEEKQQIKTKISTTLKNKSEIEKKIIKTKKEQTNIIKYGVKNSLSKDSPFRQQAELNNRNSFINRLLIWLKENNLELLGEYRGVKDQNGDIIYYNFKHTPSGNIFIDHVACGRLPQYKNPNVSIGISEQERELQNFIKELLPTEEIIFNSRNLVKGFEIDIYIPKHNLAIEYNGLYWHSELNGKLKEYHLYKTQICELKNIQLIHIFEDEWNNNRAIVKSKLRSLLHQNQNKIFARKCIVKEVNNKEKNIFLNKNHIQGEDKSKVKLGLYYNNELVSLITFGKLRKITGNKHEDNKYELIRFATKLNTNVTGGFSKLLNYFIKKYLPIQIISYADRRWSMGKLYVKSNFTFIHNTPPNYWYMKYYKHREHRYKYRKSELYKLLDNYNPTISEWENMKLNKYDRVWDCGSKKYEMNF